MKAPMRMRTFFANLEPKRALALALGPGAAAIGGDAAIAHFAGRDMAHPAQLLPVIVGPLACVALLAVAGPRLPEKWFRRGARAVGALLTALGTVGTSFHARALARLLEGEPLTWAGLKTALAVAPPIMAPGAFILLGVLIFALGNERLRIELAPATFVHAVA
jgi:hypothetical protein